MSARGWKKAALAALVATAAACGADFDPPTRITNLRVLALSATRYADGKLDGGGSYAAPGEKVRIDVLWHDALDPDKDGVAADGAPRKRGWGWTRCVNPASSTVFGCFAALGQELAKTGKPPELTLKFAGTPEAAAFEKDPHFDVDVPPDALDGVEAKEAATVGVVFLACAGNLVVDFAAINEKRNELPIKCLDEAGNPLGTHDFTIGLKRIYVRASDRNADPTIASLTWDGQPWPADFEPTIKPSCDTGENRFDRCDGNAHDVSMTFPDGVIESGTTELGVSFTEQVIVQFYSTEGLFENPIKRVQDPKNRFAMRSVGAGKQTLWFVVRDNRGGVSWQSRNVVVEP